MSDSQHEDGYAWTWEPAAGALATVGTCAVVSVQAGRSLALAVAGAGWHWPPSTTLVTSTAGILTGDLGAGLNPTIDAAGVGEPWVAWITAAVFFVAALTGAVVVAVRWVACRRHKGMATAAHAEQLLGLGRLRATRAVIRPDLYRKHQS